MFIGLLVDLKRIGAQKYFFSNIRAPTAVRLRPRRVKENILSHILLFSLYIYSFTDALTGYHTHRNETPLDADEILSRAGNSILNAEDWNGLSVKQ